MQRNQPVNFLPWILVLSLVTSSAGFAERKVTVFPKNSKKFRCQVGPDSIPVTVEEGMIKLRVGVVGGKGPFYWRVPFRQWSNGDNNVSLAQAGESVPSADGRFTITVDATQLRDNNLEKKIELRLIAKDGAETQCTTQIAAIEAATRTTANVKTPPPVPGLTEQAAVR